MENSKNINLKKEIVDVLAEFFDQSKHQELSEEQSLKLSDEQSQAYSRCHPVYCPNYGRPMPHSPHVPLYPTNWA